MEFCLSSEELALGENLNRLLSRHSPLETVRKACDAKDPYDPALTRALAEMGLYGLLAPEADGGLGLGVLAASVAAEHLGRFAAPAPFLGPLLGVLALSSVPDPALKSSYLPALMDASLEAGLCLEEFAAGGRRDFRIEARDGKLHGKSLLALDVKTGSCVVAATPAGEVFFVEPGAPGVRIEPLISIDRTRRLSAAHFDGAPAVVLCRTGALARRLVDVARVLIAADSLGAGFTLLDRAVDYAKERRQFGRVIGSFQAVKHLCAEVAAELEPARSLVWHGAYAQDALPSEASMLAAHAKAHLSEIGQFAARTTTEVFGGMGITDLAGLHFFFKRIGLNRQILGSPEVTRRDAARFQGLITT